MTISNELIEALKTVADDGNPSVQLRFSPTDAKALLAALSPARDGWEVVEGEYCKGDAILVNGNVWRIDPGSTAYNAIDLGAIHLRRKPDSQPDPTREIEGVECAYVPGGWSEAREGDYAVDPESKVVYVARVIGGQLVAGWPAEPCNWNCHFSEYARFHIYRPQPQPVTEAESEKVTVGMRFKRSLLDGEVWRVVEIWPGSSFPIFTRRERDGDNRLSGKHGLAGWVPADSATANALREVGR